MNNMSDKPLDPIDAEIIIHGLSSIPAVIDRNISLGLGGVLWAETRGLADAGATVQNYIAGLGGGDVRPEHILNMVADLQSREVAGPPAVMEAL